MSELGYYQLIFSILMKINDTHLAEQEILLIKELISTYPFNSVPWLGLIQYRSFEIQDLQSLDRFSNLSAGLNSIELLKYQKNYDFFVRMFMDNKCKP